MALYIPHNIFHLARLLYVVPETFGPYYVYPIALSFPQNKSSACFYDVCFFRFLVFFLNCFGLKLRNLKPRKSVSVRTYVHPQ